MGERALLGRCASRPRCHIRKGKRVEMTAHVLTNLGPYRQQYALALVVAGTVLVRLAEVARNDGPFNRADDLAKGDLARRASEHVATADSSLGSDQASPFQGEQYLLQVGLGETGAVSDVAHGSWHGLTGAQREGK